MMKLVSEDQLLDEKFRAQVIEEILHSENVNRKKELRKRYEIYKDKVRKYVEENLVASGLESETIREMMARSSNISLCKKIVNKLARSYLGGVSRETGVESSDVQVTAYADILNWDQGQKKSDRYRELYKNCTIQIIPERDQVQSDREQHDVFKMRQKVLSPWQYDVIEDAKDRELPRVYILSDYSDAVHGMGAFLGNAKDDTIADSPIESGMDNKVQFVWWSESYHFTTDQSGQIIKEHSEEDFSNPINMLPFVNIAEDQDGEFWAQGGDDLIDGSVLVNTVLTDMFAIAYAQGWGQFVISGKNVSLGQKVGPHNALVFNVEDKDDPQPSVSVVSANPPLDMWMRSVEQYVALLLTTNNLSTSTVSIKLDAAQFPSGIAMVVEMSEAVNDINDTQEMYADAERMEWEILKRWHNELFVKDALAPAFDEIGKFPDDMVVKVKFNERKPVITEKERLEIIEKRKDLGINEKIDLIMLDNPKMTREEAEAKLLKITEEKVKALQAAMRQPTGGDDDDSGE